MVIQSGPKRCCGPFRRHYVFFYFHMNLFPSHKYCILFGAINSKLFQISFIWHQKDKSVFVNLERGPHNIIEYGANKYKCYLIRLIAMPAVSSSFNALKNSSTMKCTSGVLSNKCWPRMHASADAESIHVMCSNVSWSWWTSKIPSRR